MTNIYAAIELGTSNTVLAIGEAENGGPLTVTYHAEIPSTGVRKSQILDINQATQSIRSVLKEIEKRQEGASALSIGNAFLAVTGQHIRTDRATGVVSVDGSKITNDEIHEARRRSHEIPLAKGRELLDIVEEDFAIDGLSGVNYPQGMSGRILKLNALHIHADSNRLQDARTAAENAHLEIRDTVFATTAAADAVLEDYERKNGCLVIDLGGGSTGYAVYSDGYLITTGVIGVGGDHITNDIAHAFQTTNAQAEEIKKHEASAIVGNYTSDNARVKLSSSNTMDSRTISRLALDTVVNVRMKELMTIIRETLEEQGLLHHLHSGVVLVGGGADLRNLEPLVEQELGCSVRKGRPIEVKGLEEETSPWRYAAIAGTLLYAHRNYEEKSGIGGFFGRFFK